jgi:hypothetical protein
MQNIKHAIAKAAQNNPPRPYYSRPLGMEYSTVRTMSRMVGVSTMQSALVRAAMKG